MYKRLRLWLLLVSITLLLVVGRSAANAASANLSRSYHADTVIPNGSLVSVDSARQGFIQLADTDNSNRLLGVALPSQDSLLAIDPSNATVQVALNGTVNALVSNVNGDIKIGDQISTSPFAGIAMEAMTGNHVIGIAQTAFNAQTDGATAEQVKDNTGHKHQIEVGLIKIVLAVGSGANTSGSGSQANLLQRLIKSLTGKTIPTVRIVLSLVVTVVALISLVTLVYASIYGSIVSVGRNPLAKTAIFRTLTSVMVMAVITVLVACVTIYYLLR